MSTSAATPGVGGPDPGEAGAGPGRRSRCRQGVSTRGQTTVALEMYTWTSPMAVRQPARASGCGSPRCCGRRWATGLIGSITVGGSTPAEALATKLRPDSRRYQRCCPGTPSPGTSVLPTCSVRRSCAARDRRSSSRSVCPRSTVPCRMSCRGHATAGLAGPCVLTGCAHPAHGQPFASLDEITRADMRYRCSTSGNDSAPPWCS